MLGRNERTMSTIRFAILSGVCAVYADVGTILVALGVLAIVNLFLNENNESLEVLGGAGVGLGLIGAGSFAFIVSLLAFIGNAVADIKPDYED